MHHDFSRLKILVVDDQQLVRNLVCQSLRGMGVKPDNLSQASDGSLGLRLLDVRPIDLVICDIEMSPINGLDLLKDLRCGRTMAASNLPFVFLSGHADRGNVVLAARFHVDGFIVKPPKPLDVEKAIDSALSRPRPQIDPFFYLGIATGTEHDKQQASSLLLQERGPVIAAIHPLESIQPGAQLARDLRTQSGHLLLQRGARLTANQLAALRDFRDRYGVSELAIVTEKRIA